MLVCFPPLLQVILKEREERKQNRLLQERGLDPHQETGPTDPLAGEQDPSGDTGQ